MTVRAKNSISDRVFALLLLAAGVAACVASVLLQRKTGGVNGGTFR
ncbi:MAG: hypothetical protein IJK12_02285 [Clostridia bacterium]|nr:hypothetical protein [Clostridia bacterium]